MRSGIPLRALTHPESVAHAVDDIAVLSGAMDAVCGVQLRQLDGPWPPAARPPCALCAEQVGLSVELVPA